MKLLDILTGMAVPKVCEVCGRDLVEGENFLCLHCLAEVRDKLTFADDARLERLPRTAPIKRVVSWIPYTHEHPLCVLIRRGKYENRPELIARLSAMYAKMLVAEGGTDGVELLVPVGMYWLKRIRRGYNQAEIIADTIGAEAGIMVEKRLKACRSHRSQTRGSADVRAENVRGIFRPVEPGSLAGLHIGVVDDVLTTGATLSEAINSLVPGNPESISVFTLAITSH